MKKWLLGVNGLGVCLVVLIISSNSGCHSTFGFGLFWMSLLVFRFFVYLLTGKPTDTAEVAMTKPYSYTREEIKSEYNQPNKPSVPTDWEKRNAKRNEFVLMYQNKDWLGMVEKFEGYDYSHHGEGQNDLQAMAIAHMKLGNYEAAATFINKSAAEFPYVKQSIYLNMAILCQESGKNEECIEWMLRAEPSLLRAEKQWTDFYRAIRVGAKSFMELGKMEECINFLKTAPISARILDADIADVHELLGECYESIGQYKKALASYQKVVTVRYDKEINRRILDLNQLIYEGESAADLKKKNGKMKDFLVL